MADETTTPKYDALTRKKREWLDLYFTMGRNATAASRAMGYRAPEKHGYRMSKNVQIGAAIAERLNSLQIRAEDVLYRISQRAEASGEDFLRFEVVERTRLVRRPVSEAIGQLEADLDDLLDLPRPSGVTASDDALAERTGIEKRLARLRRLQERDPDATAHVPVLETVEVGRFDLAAMRDAGKLHLVKSVTKNADGSQKVELHDAAHADDVLAKHLGLLTDRVDVTSGGEPLKEIRVSIAPPRERGS